MGKSIKRWRRGPFKICRTLFFAAEQRRKGERIGFLCPPSPLVAETKGVVCVCLCVCERETEREKIEREREGKEKRKRKVGSPLLVEQGKCI